MFKRSWRRGALATIAVVAIAATTACSPGASGDGSSGGSGDGSSVLRVRLAGSPVTPDPFREIANYAWDVMRNVYEGVVSLDENYDPIPMIAESWDQSDDGATYTFHIREGLKFHNGEELDADDVKYSLDYYRENAFRASDLGAIESVTVLDPQTVQVDLNRTQGNFLVALGAPIGPVVVPEGSADDDGLVTNPVGTGPYQIDSFTESKVLLSKFEDYQSIDLPTSGFGGAKEALIEQVEITVVEETQTALAGMETEEFDLITEFPPLEIERAEGMTGWSLESVTSTSLNNFYINVDEKGITDPQIRGAVLAAVDRQQLLDTTGQGAGELTHSFISPIVSWYNKESAEYWPWDGGVEQAKQILASSNYDGEPIELISGLDEQHDNAVLIGQSLEAAGFNVQLTKLDFSAYLERLNAGEFQFAVTGTPARIPVDNLYNEWYCDGGKLDKRFGYCDPEYDKLYEEAISTVDADERNAIFAQLEKKLKDEAVIDPWYFYDNIVAVHDNVEGYEPMPSAFLTLWGLSIKN